MGFGTAPIALVLAGAVVHMPVGHMLVGLMLVVLASRMLEACIQASCVNVAYWPLAFKHYAHLPLADRCFTSWQFA